MRIRSITVSPGSAEAVLEFAEGEPLRTSELPGSAGGAVLALPGLRGHRCRNTDGRSFREELEDTELAHLFEHAALEIMALAGSPDTLKGDTVWDFAADGRGVFRVRVGYDDDLVCLGAMKAAGALVEALIGRDAPPDLAGEARRLRALRR